MLTRTQRALASTAVLLALVLLVGTAVFLALREDATAPPTTVTTTTTGAPTVQEVAVALADALQGGAGFALSDDEARCVADAVVAVVPPQQLGALVGRVQPLAGVSPDQRSQLLAAIVGCIPPEAAAALLGPSTTTTEPIGLPGQGEG